MGCGPGKNTADAAGAVSNPQPIISPPPPPPSQPQMASAPLPVPCVAQNEPIIWLNVPDPILPPERTAPSVDTTKPLPSDQDVAKPSLNVDSGPAALDTCPNGHHALIWEKTPKPESCSRCGEPDTVFFGCHECGHRICANKCRPGAYGRSTVRCPNGHELKWGRNVTANYACNVCEKPGCPSGFMCVEDGYFVCVPGCRKIRSAKFCPNGHALEWHKVTRSIRCDACGRMDNQVYTCASCSFAACHLCKGDNRLTRSRLRLVKKAPGIKSRPKTTTKRRSPEPGTGRTPEKLQPETKQHVRERSSPPKKELMVGSRKCLGEMSGLVSDLLERNAVIQQSLASVISRNHGRAKTGNSNRTAAGVESKGTISPDEVE